MRINRLFLLTIISLIAINVSAQKTWEKPFKKWNQDDAVKILTSSPWVTEYQGFTTDIDKKAMAAQTKEMAATLGGISSGGTAPSGNDAKSIARDVAMPIITVRLHSSLPVREALVRLQQIGAGYDKMNEKAQAEFDEKTKNTLECPLCQKYYIVSMSKSVNSSGQSVEEGLFQTMNFDQLKGNIWLINDKGDKQELGYFLPPKGAKDLAIFFFPRKDKEGNDFIRPENKLFKVEFNNAFLTSNNSYAKFLVRSVEFKVASLKVGENLSF